ncbi:uncharacterized protein LOC120161421, partial [Hibiscus syriacus]|uniref:uncharacterized protein LOC120161421 n=1 Tax=Hibiscus syriacus TaxID=106335 RepID=UPI001922905A
FISFSLLSFTAISRGTEKLIETVKQFADSQYKLFTTRYGQQVIDILELPIKVVLSPFTLAFDIAGSAPRGFGIPEFISKLSYTSVFAIAALGTYDIALELGKKVICQSLQKYPPPRPRNWGRLDLPLNASSWSEDDLKDPAKLYEMTVLLNAQREIADKLLDAQWETKWRQEKLNETLEEKVCPYIQNIDNGVLPQPIVIQSRNGNLKKSRRRKLLFLKL